ncbi:MAG: hypothetical protein JWP91_1950 [Fibrobacteres bacterium]|nr:hypothetical protein [Fibrobacterota bacterium]
MRFKFLAFVSTLAFGILQARAVDVSGNVLSKLGDPIPGAKVCIKSDPTKCVTTDAQGAFRIASGAIGIRKPAPSSVPDGAAYRMDFRNGILFLDAPAASGARLEWTAASGRTLFAATDVKLARGRNALALPRGLPENGICFIRLQTPDHSLVWKAVVAGPQGKASFNGGEPASGRVLALSKAASAGTLEISKTGFRTRTYEPASDPETGAIIMLGTPDDIGLTFTGSFSAKVISIDRANRSMIVENVDAFCEGGAVARDTTRDTSLYAFRNGKFWLWEKGACQAQVFNGTGTDPVGTFTLADPEAELPADLRAGCTDSSAGNDIPFQSFNAIYVVTETRITGDLSLELCAGDLYGPFIGALLGQDTGVTMTKNTCNQVVFANKAENGVLDFTRKGDSLHFKFTYKSKTCTADQDFAFSDRDPICPEDTTSIDSFLECMITSGFVDTAAFSQSGGPSPMAKASAATRPATLVRAPWPMSMESRPPRIGPASLPVRSPAAGLRESILSRYGWRSKIP